MFYAVDDLDEVVPLAEIPRPDVGAPLPRLVADEHEARVTYYVRGNDDEETTATFSGLYALYLGAPNEEAFEGHPLASRGLLPWGAFEIRQSSWIRAPEWMNRVHPHHRPKAFASLRHFVLSFHDTTFESVAEDARAR